MTVHRLSSDDLENDYTLIAIHSNTEPYKLAFEINQKIKIQLKRCSYDVSFDGNNSVFDLYKHSSETYNTKLFLILNRSFNEKKIQGQLLFENLSESSFLIPELKKVEYLLKIEEGGFNIKSLLRKLNELNNIISCYRVKITAAKSKYNLIFE
tara:strand:- start:311 stop:769 length:459 start_codon:yes stop_codon:yes gene_type:complete